MLKYLSILFFLIILISCAKNSTLDSQTIILDDEAKQVISEYKNPKDLFQVVPPPNAEKNKSQANELLTKLIKEFKPKCKFFIKEDYGFLALMNDSQIIKIIIPLSEIAIDLEKYKVNKIINNDDELILVTEMFRRAWIRNMMDGTWDCNKSECEYSNTDYSQFRYSDIHFANLKDINLVLKKYL